MKRLCSKSEHKFPSGSLVWCNVLVFQIVVTVNVNPLQARPPSFNQVKYVPVCKGFLMRVWTYLVQSSEVCLLAKRLQCCLALHQCLGCDSAFSTFPIWIISLSAVIRKISLAAANTAGERCRSREGIYDFSAFLTIRQAEQKELQAYIWIKYTNTRKRMEAGKSSLYLGKWWISHWIPMLFVWERLMFSGCIIYSFVYLKSFVVFTLS